MTPVEVGQRLREIEARAAARVGVLDAASGRPVVVCLREFLQRCERQEPVTEAKISMPDPGLQYVFRMLCDRYGLRVHRAPRQRTTSLTVAGPRTFIQGVLGPMFQEMVNVFDAWFLEQTNAALAAFGAATTSEVTRSDV